MISQSKIPSFPEKGRVTKDSSNLDLLRSIAVLAVFMAHLLRTFGINKVLIIDVRPLGTVGVLIFFVHTSLVLMMSMERLALRGWALCGAFYVRRIFRIYPLSIVCVLAVFWMKIPRMPWDPIFESVSIKALINNLLLIQSFRWTAPVIGCLWSLPFELAMYVLLPFIFLAARKYPSPAMALVFWIFSLPLALATRQLPNISGIDFFMFVPCFLGGLVAYQISARMPRRHHFGFWFILILGVIAVYVVFHPDYGWIECLILGWAAPRFRETGLPWLRKATHSIAQYSYGIYLLHAPLMWIAFKRLHGQPTFFQWAVFSFLMISLCLISYHLIEAPMLRIGGDLALQLKNATSKRRQESGRGWAAQDVS